MTVSGRMGISMVKEERHDRMATTTRDSGEVAAEWECTSTSTSRESSSSNKTTASDFHISEATEYLDKEVHKHEVHEPNLI